MGQPVIPVLLGFNEPDQSHGGGSGIDVDRALESWMQLVAKAKLQGYESFVAPSIAQALPARYGSGVATGSEWLPNFLHGCLDRHGCPETINYLGFHMYEPDCPTNVHTVRTWSIDRRIGSLKKLMAEFNGKGMQIQGLWLTEFAGRSDENGGCSSIAECGGGSCGVQLVLLWVR